MTGAGASARAGGRERVRPHRLFSLWASTSSAPRREPSLCDPNPPSSRVFMKPSRWKLIFDQIHIRVLATFGLKTRAQNRKRWTFRPRSYFPKAPCGPRVVCSETRVERREGWGSHTSRRALRSCPARGGGECVWVCSALPAAGAGARPRAPDSAGLLRLVRASPACLRAMGGHTALLGCPLVNFCLGSLS